MRIFSTLKVHKTIIRLVILITVVFTNTATGADLFRVDREISGKIIDFETKKPVSGAVVMALWCKEVFRLTIESKSEYYDYYETLSDKDGNFTIPGKGLIIFKDVPPPRIKIYKNGYRVLNLWRWNSKSFNDISPRHQVEWNSGNPVIHLGNSTLEERRNSVKNFSQVPFSEMAGNNIPPDKYRLYREEVEREYEVLGRVPYWKQDHRKLRIKTRVISPSGNTKVKPKSPE